MCVVVFMFCWIVRTSPRSQEVERDLLAENSGAVNNVQTDSDSEQLVAYQYIDLRWWWLGPYVVVSQARPFPLYSVNCFQYWHMEKGCGDLGSLHVNV